MKKRKIKKRFVKEIKFFVFVLIIILVLLAILFSIFFIFFPKKNILISPISNKKDVYRNEIETSLEKSGINFVSIKNSQDFSYLVTLKEGGEVIFVKDKNLQNQISSLQLILSRLTIEGKRFKSLDFRYDKPVVSF